MRLLGFGKGIASDIFIAVQQFWVGEEVVFHLMLVSARCGLKRCEATEQQPAARFVWQAYTGLLLVSAML